MTTLADQLSALMQMPPAQLRAEWRRVYQSPPSPRLTTDLLRRGIAYKLQERVHGGLPSHIARELDRLAKRRLADAVAAAAASAAASADASADGHAHNAVPPRRIEEPRLRPGTRLVRSWQGRTYSVLVTEHGFVMDDREYPSLSRIAQAVTGTHWSAPRFFGITRKSGTRASAGAVAADVIAAGVLSTGVAATGAAAAGAAVAKAVMEAAHG